MAKVFSDNRGNKLTISDHGVVSIEDVHGSFKPSLFDVAAMPQADAIELMKAIAAFQSFHAEAVGDFLDDLSEGFEEGDVF